MAHIALLRKKYFALRRNIGVFAVFLTILHLASLFILRCGRFFVRRALRTYKWLYRRLGPRSPPVFSENMKNGVLFIGYVEASLGLGEALRGLISAVSTTTLPFGIYPFNVAVESRYAGPFMKDHYDRKSRYSVNLIYTAANQLPALFNTLGRERLSGGYNILRTYWELARAPEEWRQILSDIDEIWAPDNFVADAFRYIFDRPIMIIPPCVEILPSPRPDRSRFGMESDRFYFMFSFDYLSMPARKNPLGVLHAFRAAFPDRKENVGLVLKSIGDLYRKAKAEIKKTVSDDQRIIIIDDALSRDNILSLMASADSYVSLHRSEGFGLGMAEAMALGKPVIGTNYSGNTDFLNEETGFPIPYQLQPISFGDYPHAEGQFWAEPDLHAAAEAMRNIFEGVEARQTRADVGKAFIETHYSRSRVAELAELRLRQLFVSGGMA